MSRAIKKGATDQSTIIRIVDSGDGTPEEAVEHNTSGIALWYRREGATKTAITPAALAALDSAHSDGGIEHCDDGYYRLDLPDAACASGANGVLVGGTVTGMVIIGSYHPLVDYDPQDTVRLGLTALPNAAADAAGGLPISDAGGLDLDARIDAAISSRATPAQILTTALVESYAADGAAGTLSQLLFWIQAVLTELTISGTTGTVKKLDGSTTAGTLTYDDATTPTSVTRSG